MSTSDYQGTRNAADEVQVFNTDDDRPTTGRIRGGSIWGGVAAGLGTLLLLELILLTTGLSGGTLTASGQSESGSFVWDAIAAIVAFFVGGLVAGAASPHRDAGTGALNGIVTWAAIILGTMVLSGIVGSTIFGALGELLASQQGTLTNAADNATVTQEAADNFREVAGWAALSGALTLAACAIGGTVGSKMWPNNDHRSTTRR